MDKQLSSSLRTDEPESSSLALTSTTSKEAPSSGMTNSPRGSHDSRRVEDDSSLMEQKVDPPDSPNAKTTNNNDESLDQMLKRLRKSGGLKFRVLSRAFDEDTAVRLIKVFNLK